MALSLRLTGWSWLFVSIHGSGAPSPPLATCEPRRSGRLSPLHYPPQRRANASAMLQRIAPAHSVPGDDGITKPTCPLDHVQGLLETGDSSTRFGGLPHTARIVTCVGDRRCFADLTPLPMCGHVEAAVARRPLLAPLHERRGSWLSPVPSRSMFSAGDGTARATRGGQRHRRSRLPGWPLSPLVKPGYKSSLSL